MKKIFKTLTLAIALSGSFMCPIASHAQAVEQGNVIIDAYYGWPNMWTSVLKAAATNNNSLGVKIGSFGPIGGRVEYLLSDKIGLCLDIHAATSSVSWSDTVNKVNYNYKISANRMRICPRINIHFSQNDHLDFYATFGVGYKNTNLKSTTNDPNYNINNVSVSVTPVTWRAGIGLRYFFTKNIGASMEMGLGGILATTGLSVKF